MRFTSPQVNLLPPEVRTARSTSRVQRWMLVAVLVSLVVVVGGYFLGAAEASRAESELAAARDETVALQNEQQEYAEVTLVRQELATAELARSFSLSFEVLWDTYLGAAASVIDPTMSIDTVAVTPIDATVEPEPLDDPALATFTIVSRSAVTPDVAGWIERLDSVPGFSDTRIDVATLTATSEGVPYYEITTTIRVTEEALSGRFLAEQEEG